MTPTQAPPTKRPLAITIVGILIFVSALLNVMLGALFLLTMDWGAPAQDVVALQNASDAFKPIVNDLDTALDGMMYLVLGVVQLILGVGFWQLKRWAWAGLMSWQALKLLIDIANFWSLSAPPVFSLLFSILLVFMLNQADVRRVFQVRKLTDESTSHPSLHALDRDGF